MIKKITRAPLNITRNTNYSLQSMFGIMEMSDATSDRDNHVGLGGEHALYKSHMFDLIIRSKCLRSGQLSLMIVETVSLLTLR